MIIKCLLIACQVVCLGFLVTSKLYKQYRVMAIYLILVISGTIFSGAKGTLYVLVDFPISVFRLIAVLEVAHRQVENFQHWKWLMPITWLIAFSACFSCWVGWGGAWQTQLIELRRFAQIWAFFMLACLEAWWLFQGAGWYREKDWVAAGWLLITFNHATVSFLVIISGGQIVEGRSVIHACSWLMESMAYLSLSAIFSPFQVVRRVVLAYAKSTRYRI
jgi:hypothetical protein